MVREHGESSGMERTSEQTTPIAGVDREVVIARLTDLVERQAQQIQHLIKKRNADNQRTDVNQPQPRTEPVELVSERFRKLNPPIFEDTTDPLVAEDWLRTLNNMFQYSRIPDTEKVLCVSFMLCGSAGHWWDTVKNIEDVAVMTWERFKEIFRNKYFTAPIRIMKMNEFIQLKQGTMTVTDYLVNLSSYLGLRPDLYRDVSMEETQGMSYARVAERAQTAEQAEIRIKHAQEMRRHFQQRQAPQWGGNNRKRAWQPQSSRPFQPRQGQRPEQGGLDKCPRVEQRGVPLPPPSPPRPLCRNCGKSHFGICRDEPKTCSSFGQRGHMTSMCPRAQKDQGRVPARVFTMTKKDAEENPVVTGKLSIFGTLTYVLFDFGATHSFASIEYVRKLGRAPNLTEAKFDVMIPSGDTKQTNQILRGCVIPIEGRELYADLIVLDINDYDVILGMDWLSKYGATINC
ncbi:uncharacterized protein LOC127256895 [Andrographis paniculata]|uniref:uncharacterized protein LOC127256895 n=1 Tax=Andrographis paniculata TaxID=175694 RepID=UPI0021E91651|nr:uncharacterized protein LOC127256895 [Andrographis paniculata]